MNLDKFSYKNRTLPYFWFCFLFIFCLILISPNLYAASFHKTEIVLGKTIKNSVHKKALKLYGIKITDLETSSVIDFYGDGKVSATWFTLSKGDRLIVDLKGIRHFLNDRNKNKAIRLKYIRRISYAFRRINGVKYLRIVFRLNYKPKLIRLQRVGNVAELIVRMKDRLPSKTLVKEIVFLNKKNYEQVMIRTNRPVRWKKSLKNKEIRLTLFNSTLSGSAKTDQYFYNKLVLINSITAKRDGNNSVVYILLRRHSFAHFSNDRTHIYITLINAAKSVKTVILNSVGAKQKRKTKFHRYNGKRVTINVRNADVIDVLRMIANISKLNIIADDSVKGKITIQVKNIPWDQLLHLLLVQKGLEEERVGNVIRIAPAGVMEKERTQKLASIKAKEKLLAIEKPVIGTVPLSYIKAAQAVSIVRKIVYGGKSQNGFIIADKANNALIYSTTEKNVVKIKNAVKLIDKRKPIIEIDARIVEVAKASEKNFGIQWGGNFVASDKLLGSKINIAGGGSSTGVGSLGTTASTGDNFIVNLPGTNPLGAIGLAIGNVSNTYNLGLKISLGEINGYTKTISTPKIITLDNEKGTIEQGVQIPYTIAGTNGGPPTTDFKAANLELDVTPHITASGTILLKIKASKDTPTIVPGATAPAINTNQITSNVIVKNNSTIVLGGVFSKTDKSNTSGIPGLSKIPFFGWLFKNKSESHPRDELLIFVTTHVVKNY